MSPRLTLLTLAVLGPASAAHAQLSSNSADPYSRAFFGEAAVTVGTAFPAGRSLKATCTAAGTVSLTYSDGSTGVWGAAVGTQTFPVEATLVNAAGTTAACSYASLK